MISHALLTAANLDQVASSSKTQPQTNIIVNKFDHVNEEAAHDDDLIMHASPLEDLEELDDQHDQGSQKIASEDDVGTCVLWPVCWISSWGYSMGFSIETIAIV